MIGYTKTDGLALDVFVAGSIAAVANNSSGVRLLDVSNPLAAKSRIARAPDAGRLASLLGTAQMAVAILNSVDAEAMLGGTGRFEAYGAVSLRLLLPIAGRLLIARTDFPARHAWLVTGALAGTELAPAPQPGGDPGIPWHPGSLTLLEGRPEPGDD